MNEKELRSVLSIDIWEDSKLVADFFRSEDEYLTRSPVAITDQSSLMEFKDEQSTRGKILIRLKTIY